MKRFIQRFVPMYHGFLNKMRVAFGHSIVIDDASDEPLVGLKVFGKSTQNGTPTPDSPVEIVSVENPTVTICGKNLIDISQGLNDVLTTNNDGTYTITKISTARRFSEKIPISIPAGTKFCFNYKLVEQSCIQPVQNQVFFSDETTTTLEYGREISYEKDIVGCRLYISVDDSIGTYSIIRDCQIEINGTVTDYEPFINGGSLSLPITLHGIPVTSGGNYTDANGQQWICDEVDFKRGVYVQRINKITHDGTFGHFVTSHTNGQRYSTLKPKDVADIGIVLCDRYTSTTWADTDKKIYLITGTIVITDSRFTDGEAALSILQAEQPEILYPLGEPIETPLTVAQIAAYKSLHTNEPNTTISNDKDAWMEVNYISK